MTNKEYIDTLSIMRGALVMSKVRARGEDVKEWLKKEHDPSEVQDYAVA